MKKNLSRIIALLMTVLTMLTTVNAFALTEGNKYSYKERFIDAHYSTGRWETADGHVHDNQGQVALRNLSNGDPLYCIQIYNHCNSNDATAEDIRRTDLWRNELSEDQQYNIIYTSIYGFPNFKYGYSDDEAQIATQVLIWEIETGARDDWSTGCNNKCKQQQ